ncbi:MAG: hypothetical protein GXX89_08285 [Clostridiales bacterium]|jgi:NRPS condensation-like uncharacterized protein|nr:hypothetical protein [Clostridiales bacterium]
MKRSADSSRTPSEGGRKLRWMRLDNAAKIFPAARRRNWNNVFRLSATLTENIDPATLQSALDVTVKRFPSIAVRLRTGLFWYFLEEVPKAPPVQRENSYPLTPMSFADIQKCAFRVLYYKKRIAVEFFHALTDGNGGLVFLKTLTAEYLTQKGVDIPNDNGVLCRLAQPTQSELEDSFQKNESLVSAGRKEAPAFRLTGEKEPDGYLNVTTGILPSGDIIGLARKYGVSVTTLLCAVLIECFIGIQNERVPHRKRHRAVKICVPVNLRKMFTSESLRNYVLTITPGVDPRLGDYTFEEILKSVHHQLGVELTSKQMSAKIAANVNAERVWALKIMPLFIKNIAMKLVYNTVGERHSCITLSNLGVVTLPAEMEAHVERLDFVLGVQATYPNNCGVLSYKDKVYINFIRNTKEPTLELKFFTYLLKLGIRAAVESNQR